MPLVAPLGTLPAPQIGPDPLSRHPMDLSKHLENAADAVKRRQYPFAIKVYSQLLSIQPDHEQARRGLREALFQKVAQKPASRATAMLTSGVNLLVAAVLKVCRNPAGAANAYERYLAADPLHEGANLALAECLQRAGYRKGALAVLQSYAVAQPRCLPAARGAGALLYEQGRLQEALAMYEQALKIDPRDQESLKRRKDLAAEGALRSTGIEQAKSSRELIKDKEQQRQLERQDRLQMDASEVASELEQLEAKLGGSPDDLNLLKRVARLRELQQDVQGALVCIERACAVNPTDADLQDQAGDLRLRLQEQMVQKARKRGDEAAAARASKLLEEARVAEFRRRTQRNPADLDLRHRLGAALLEVGDVDGSIAELQQAVKDPRRRTEAHFLLGRAFQRKELPEMALGQYEKVLAAAGDSPMAKDARYELGNIHLALGRRDAAMEQFARIMEQDIGFRDVAQKVAALKNSKS